MPKYIFVRPGNPTTDVLIVTPDTYLIEVPDGVNPYTVDVSTAADDTRLAIIPLLEQLEWDDEGDQALAYEAGLITNTDHKWSWEEIAWAYRGLWFELTGEDPSEGI